MKKRPKKKPTSTKKTTKVKTSKKEVRTKLFEGMEDTLLCKECGTTVPVIYTYTDIELEEHDPPFTARDVLVSMCSAEHTVSIPVQSTREIEKQHKLVIKELKEAAKIAKNNRIYFSKETEDAIVKYNETEDPEERERIFREHIAYPLDKLAENVINRFKFPYINQSFEQIKQQVVSFLVINLSKYTSNKGKAFSYFSVIAKNYLILHNNMGYKQEKRAVYLSDTTSDNCISIEEMINLQLPETSELEDYKEFVKLMIDYWDANHQRVFKKKRDIDIANAIIELFKRADRIENFNKKALYLMIREMTDCKTSYITKVVNKMRNHVLRQMKDYRKYGTLMDKENKFFTYSIDI